MQAFFDIDTQIDFLYPAGAIYAPGAEKLIPAIKALNTYAVSNGIALISHYLVADALRAGTLKPVLRDFPIPELWVKAAIPARRRNAAAVQALLVLLKTSLAPSL